MALLVWFVLILLHGNFWQAGPTLAAARPGTAPPVAPSAAPRIAIVVPARDEAPVIIPSLRSLLTQDYPGGFRVILVDDGSTDGTGALARELARRLPEAANADRLCVLRGTPPPAGWSGKLWAVAQGIVEANDPAITAGTYARAHRGTNAATSVGTASATSEGTDTGISEGNGATTGTGRSPGISEASETGIIDAADPGITHGTDIAETAGDAELLLLTDADIVHDPRHLSALVAWAERDGLDLVSEMVELACDSLAERALVPAFVYFFQLLYPFAWVNDPLRETAAAAGGTILLRRRALTGLAASPPCAAR